MHNIGQALLELHDTKQRLNKKITFKQYQDWQRNFTWDGLLGMRYGASFCKHFDIPDRVLKYYTSVCEADRYIRAHYLDDRNRRLFSI